MNGVQVIVFAISIVLVLFAMRNGQGGPKWKPPFR
jgi:hypothetical protein